MMICSDEGLMLETSATHQTQQTKNMPYQPLLIKPTLSLLANAENADFCRTSLPVFDRQIYTPTDRQTDRQTDTPTDRQTDR